MGWNHQLVEGWLNFRWFFDRLRSHGMDLAFFPVYQEKKGKVLLGTFSKQVLFEDLGKFGCHFSKSQKAGEVNIQLIGCVVPRRWHQCDPLFPVFKPRKWQQQFQTQSLTNPRNKKTSICLTPTFLEFCDVWSMLDHHITRCFCLSGLCIEPHLFVPSCFSRKSKRCFVATRPLRFNLRYQSEQKPTGSEVKARWE